MKLKSLAKSIETTTVISFSRGPNVAVRDSISLLGMLRYQVQAKANFKQGQIREPLTNSDSNQLRFPLYECLIAAFLPLTHE